MYRRTLTFFVTLHDNLPRSFTVYRWSIGGWKLAWDAGHSARFFADVPEAFNQSPARPCRGMTWIVGVARGWQPFSCRRRTSSCGALCFTFTNDLTSGSICLPGAVNDCISFRASGVKLTKNSATAWLSNQLNGKRLADVVYQHLERGRNSHKTEMRS